VTQCSCYRIVRPLSADEYQKRLAHPHAHNSSAPAATATVATKCLIPPAATAPITIGEAPLVLVLFVLPPLPPPIFFLLTLLSVPFSGMSAVSIAAPFAGKAPS
jgi:hypothetical protein